MTIVFAGTPEFAAVQLAALLGTRHRTVAVYTQPDRPAGRGRRPRPSAVKCLAERHEIPVRQPAALTGEGAVRELAGLQPDVVVVAAYGLLLPRGILELPRLGCINVHASLLPRWRGAAPIQWAIIAGDAETGVSIMCMDEGLDTGDVLRQAHCPIRALDSAGDLHDRLARLGAETLLATLDDLAAGRAHAAAQNSRLATYAPRIAKADARIEWRRPAAELERRVRAFNPWPVAHTRCDAQTLRIWQAQALPEAAAAPPGTVLQCNRRGIDVATGAGVLRLLALQRAGGKRMAVADFVNACPLQTGRVLS